MMFERSTDREIEKERNADEDDAGMGSVGRKKAWKKALHE